MLDWLVHTNAGMWTRVALGVAVLSLFKLVDLKRNGKRATRWREYAVLAGCTLAAMAYAVANDQITSSISWEYFYYGKGTVDRARAGHAAE